MPTVWALGLGPAIPHCRGIPVSYSGQQGGEGEWAGDDGDCWALRALCPRGSGTLCPLADPLATARAAYDWVWLAAAGSG